MKKKSKRAIFGAGALGGVLILSFVVHNHQEASDETADAAPTVAVVKAARGDVIDVADYEGEFRPFEEVELHPKVSGYLREINVDVGDRVKQGQIIAQLENPELDADLLGAKAQVESKQSEVKRLEAEKEEAALTFSRLTQVAAKDSHLVAKQELDAVRTKAAASEAALATAMKQVAQAQADEVRTETLVRYSTISAPFDGIVTKRYVDPGALIQAATSSNSQTSPLVHIVEDTKLRFSFFVPESVANRVRVGQSLQITAQFLERPIPVRVSRSSDNLDHDTRTMLVEADVESTDRKIIPGSFGTAHLQLDEHSGVTTIPQEALSGVDNHVFVVGKDNKLEERSPVVGLSNGHLVEIQSGISDGELVVIGRKARLVTAEKVIPKLAEHPGDLTKEASL